MESVIEANGNPIEEQLENRTVMENSCLYGVWNPGWKTGIDLKSIWNQACSLPSAPDWDQMYFN